MVSQILDGRADISAGAGKTLSKPAYPSYKSFDGFIDVERLRSLDSYIATNIRRYMLTNTPDLFVNEHRLESDSAYAPGVKEIWLTRTLPGTPYNYLDINAAELWQRTPEADAFSLLMDFVDTLPFKALGRVLLIFDDAGNAVPAHRDHEEIDICHDFIWLRTNLGKPFYLLDHETGEKLYVQGYSAWFDTVNQYHGSDAAPGLNFSFRVDGTFTDEFRKQIPVPVGNAASAPAVWAATSGI